METCVSIQARMGSSRLPGKVLLPLGERRILGWVVERVRKSQYSVQIAVTTGDRPENDAVREWCRREGVQCSTGPEDDLLERHRRVASKTDTETLVRITADCPFVPPSEIERIVSEHTKHDVGYTTNVTDRMPVGTGVDVIDTALMNELAEKGETHPVLAARNDPNSWPIRFSDNSTWEEFRDAHIAVDTPADYWNLVDALDTVGSDPMAVTEWVSKER